MPRKVARVRIAVVFLGLALASFAAVKFVSYAKKKSAPAAPTSASVTDTVAFAPGGDLNLNTKANPGDKLDGTIIVSASGSAATGTKVTIPISSLLTLDNTFGTNGVMVTPLAANYAYSATGNITISQPTGAGSLVSNDIDPVSGNNTGLVATAQTISSTNCTGGCSGNVTINADGSFSYVSPPNFTGADTFTYTITSSSGGTATGTATVNVTDRIVFVASGGVGNCRPVTPCSLATADALAAPTAGTGKDLVYVLNNAAYSSAVFTMNASQNLVGQGVSLAQALTDSGITLATNSVNPGTAASTNPIFNNAGNILTLSTNNLVERFALNPSGGSAIVGTSIASGTDNINNISVGASGVANGLNLTTNTGGTFSFSTIALTTATGTALIATGGGTVNVATGSTINAVTGQAVNANGVALNATFSSTTSGGGTNGIGLTTVTGTSAFGSGTLSAATAAEFLVSGGSPTVSYTGAITQNNAQRVVDIQGTTANTVTLSGTITGGASSLGVHIGDTSAVNGNVTFTTLNLGTSGARMTNQAVTIGSASTSTGTYGLGTIAIFTSGAKGLGCLNADGTLNVTGGTIDSSGATAIDIDGPAGLTTLSIPLTSVNSAGGTADGISIQDANGSFTISGDGANTAVGGNSTGGTISGKSGADAGTATGIGVYLNNVSNITLRRLTINGTNQNYGIRAFAVNNFTMEYSTVGGTNGTTASIDNFGEGSAYFGNASNNGITGTGTFTNNSISGGRTRNQSIENGGAASTLTLTVKGCTFGAEQSFSDAGTSFEVESRTSGSTINSTFGGTLAGEPNTLTSAVGSIVDFTGQTGTTMDVVMRNNSLSDNHPNNIAGGGGLSLQTQGAMTAHVTGNSMRDANGAAVTLFKAAAATSMTAFFDSNTIGVAGTLDSGSKTANGIFVSAAGGGTMSYTITNNQIHQIHGNSHIYADNTGGSYAANFDIRGNTLDTPGAGWFAGIAITNGSPSSTDTVNVCAVVGGSTAANKNTFNLGGSGKLAIIVGSSGQNGGHVFNLPGFP
jgi:hypothetical protein